MIPARDVPELARAVLGDAPRALVEVCRRTDLELAFQRRDRLREPHGAAALEIWVVKARWHEQRQDHARTFFRVAAQG